MMKIMKEQHQYAISPIYVMLNIHVIALPLGHFCHSVALFSFSSNVSFSMFFSFCHRLLSVAGFVRVCVFICSCFFHSPIAAPKCMHGNDFYKMHYKIYQLSLRDCAPTVAHVPFLSHRTHTHTHCSGWNLSGLHTISHMVSQ